MTHRRASLSRRWPVGSPQRGGGSQPRPRGSGQTAAHSRFSLVAGLLISLFGAFLSAQGAANQTLHKPLDEVLDLYVRDGLVYYRALRSDRRKLDAYLATLEQLPSSEVAGWARNDQVALWLNAYNAHVLKAVIDRYPIGGKSSEYPRNSIRQIPGVFERTPRRVAGRSLTLDQIEVDVIAGFDDPRLTLAIGRGSVGGGRLRSEAFTGDNLEAQLARVAAEFPTRRESLRIDVAARTVSVTPILSWRETLFVRVYADKADQKFAQRSPIERALVAFILPNLLPGERAFVQRNEFKVSFHSYDWRLNDLTGGGPR